MAAEILARGAQRVEPFEHFFARFRRNTGAFIGHREFHPVEQPLHRDIDVTSGGRERHCVIQQVFQHAHQPRRIARNVPGTGVCGRDGDAAGAVAAALHPGADQPFGQREQIDRHELGAAKLGVDPAGFGDFGDQPVDPPHVMRGNRGQLAAELRVVDLFQRFERAAQAGQRVLDFVRDVGGEGFDAVDPAAQRGGHVGNRAGEQADLVAPFGQARHYHRAVTAQPHPHRRADQRAQRLNNGAGQEQRELDRDDQRYRQHDHQCLTRVADRLGDVGGVAGRQQHFAARADGGGGVDDRCFIGGGALNHDGLAQSHRADHFGPGVGAFFGRVGVRFQRRRAEQIVHPRID